LVRRARRQPLPVEIVAHIVDHRLVLCGKFVEGLLLAPHKNHNLDQKGARHIPPTPWHAPSRAAEELAPNEPPNQITDRPLRAKTEAREINCFLK
jgi:hypothetical protein